MRAVQLSEFGPPDVLELVELDDPVPGPGQVLIDVSFAGITFVDTQLRAGRPPVEGMRPQLPVVLGNSVAGVVIGLSPDVDPGVLGRRVTASLSGCGGYADRAVADAPRVIPVADGTPLDQAVAIVADGRTALALMNAVGDVEGRTVLVEAAAGGVGGLLVQLVSGAGGRVIGAAGGAAKLAVAAELGADVTIDYSDPSWPDVVRRRVGELDLVFDGVGGGIGRAGLSLVRAGGSFCSFGAAAGAGLIDSTGESGREDVRWVSLAALDVRRQVELATDALDRVASGGLRPTVGQVFDLSQAATAHAAIESRATIGKTLLRTFPSRG